MLQRANIYNAVTALSERVKMMRARWSNCEVALFSLSFVEGRVRVKSMRMKSEEKKKRMTSTMIMGGKRWNGRNMRKATKAKN